MRCFRIAVFASLYYALTDNWDGATRDPAALHAFDGTNVTQYPLGGETISARCLAVFIERLFLGFAKTTITNQLGTTVAYDPSAWSSVTTNAELITNGSTITGRLTPTATTGSQRYEVDVYTVAASTSEQAVVFAWSLKGVSPTYAMPVTLEVYYSQAWVADTAMTVGAIRVPTAATGNGFRYRVQSVAGDTKTHAATEPTWPTTPGTTVVDDQVTWVCDGPDAVASAPATVPSATDRQLPSPVSCRAAFPPTPASSKIGVRLKFGTTATPTVTLAPIDVSYRDGLDDADPRKANWGAQLTVGNFAHRFFNAEDSAASVGLYDDFVFWTDPFDPTKLFANYSYKLDELPGPITAMCVASNRLVVFKKYGIWIFRPTDDPDNPILLDQFISNYGCKGPRALTVYRGKIYFVGNPDEVYEYEVGGEPRPLANDAMRDRLLFTLSTLTYFSIAVDEKSHDLYVTTRTGESGVLNLDSERWATAVSNSQPFGGMLWNPDLQSLYAWQTFADAQNGGNPMYLNNDTAAATDGGSVAVAAYVEWHMASLIPNSVVSVLDVGVLNQTTGAQTSQTAKVEASRDGGATFDKYVTYVVPTVSTSTIGIPFEVKGLRQTSHTLALRLYHSGKGGGGMFRIAAAYARVLVTEPSARVIAQPTISETSL